MSLSKRPQATALVQATVAGFALAAGAALLGWLLLAGKDTGLSDVEFGAALLLSVTNVLIAALSWRNAWVIDRLEAQRASREQEHQLLLAATDAAANGIMITDRDGRILWVNQSFMAITGYTLDEAIGHTPGALIRSGVQDQAFYQNLWDTILSGRVWSSELTNRRKDGRLYSEQITITPVCDATGSVAHFIAIKHDLSERKRIEAELRDSEERFRQITERIPDLYWVHPVNAAEPIYVSPAYEEILGRPRENLLTRRFDWAEAIHPDDRERVRERFDATLQRGDEFDIEYRIVRPNGEIRHLHTRASAVRNAAGCIYRVVGVATDITERINTQEQLRHLSTHDSLTGLFNRAFFQAELERFERDEHFPISIVVADLDDLKRVNDQDGHAAGDTMLRKAAQVLANTFRNEDLVARIGGDEFAVLLPRTEETTARGAVVRLREDLVRRADGRPGISIGVATAANRHELVAALNLADRRMYHDKTARKVGRKFKDSVASTS